MDQLTKLLMRLTYTPRWVRSLLMTTVVIAVATLTWFMSLTTLLGAGHLLSRSQFFVMFFLAFIVRIGLYAWAVRFWLKWKRQRLEEESDPARQKAARLSALRAEVGLVATILAMEYIVWQAFIAGSGQ